MQGIKKIFAKSNSQTDRFSDCASPTVEKYKPLDRAEARRLPTAQLYKILCKNDNEILFLKSEMQRKERNVDEMRGNCEELKSQLWSFKQTNCILSQEISMGNKHLHECQDGKLRVERQLEITLEQLKEKDALIGSYSGRGRTEDTGDWQGGSLQELAITNKIYKNDIDSLMLKVENLLKENCKLQGSTGKLQNDYQAAFEQNEELKTETRKLKFQKESAEFEMKTLRENLNFKESLVKAKNTKIRDIANKAKLVKEGAKSAKEELRMASETISALLHTELRTVRGTEKHVKLCVSDLLKQVSNAKNTSVFINEDNLHDTILLIGKENEELKSRLDLSKRNNEKLVKQLIGLRRKRENAKEEVLKLNDKLLRLSPDPTSPLSAGGQRSMDTSSVLLTVRNKVSKLYKQFLSDMRKSSNGDMSVYSLGTSAFSNIERGLNDINMLISENLELLDGTSEYYSKVLKPKKRVATAIVSARNPSTSEFIRKQFSK